MRYEITIFSVVNVEPTLENTLSEKLSHSVGAGTRFIRTGLITEAVGESSFNPHENYNSYSAFIQDKITLSDTRSFTLGTKFEHSALTGVDTALSAIYKSRRKSRR